MKIGFDVDGVLTDLENYQLEYGKKYFGEDKLVNEDGYIGWTIEEILRDVMGMNNTNSDFFQNLWAKFTSAIENEDTSEASEIGKQLLQMLHPSNVTFVLLPLIAILPPDAV